MGSAPNSTNSSIRCFARLQDDFHLVALDRPGSGYSVRAAGAGAGLSEQARVVVRLIERLRLERPLLVGHSLGGMVALAVAIEHPQAISGLALLAPYTRYQAEAVPAFAPLLHRQPLGALADLAHHRGPDILEDRAASP